MTHSTVHACIFDLDGTLLNSELISSQAMQMVLDKYGVKESWEIKSRILGLRGEEWGKLVVDYFNLQGQLDPTYLTEQWELNLKVLSPTIEKMDGAMELVSLLQRHNIKLAIATSSHLSAVEVKRQSHEELFAAMDAIICGDHEDVSNGKPAPDIYKAAAKALGVDCDKCLAFEDALSGVRSARSANMHCIAIPDPRMEGDMLRAFKQTTPLIAKSLNELDLSSFGFHDRNGNPVSLN
jgi:pseudouridine 5'-phosphatase